jgi:hypothetical protein
MSHLAERFEAAVVQLTADGSLKQRLSRAYSEHLEGLQAQELPQSIAPVYADLHAALHRVPPLGNETRARASVRKMSSADAARHAAAIVSMYGDLLRHGERAEPLKVVEPSPRSVPAYLVGGS